jgi:hypothetical protein
MTCERPPTADQQLRPTMVMLAFDHTGMNEIRHDAIRNLLLKRLVFRVGTAALVAGTVPL